MMAWLWLAACTVTVDGKTLLGEAPVDEARTVAAFDRISSESSVDVEVTLVAEGPQQVVVEAQPDDHASVNTVVEDGLLRITSESGFFSSRKVRVTVPSIDALTVTSTGDLDVDGLDGRALRVVASGSGDVDLEGTVGDLDVAISSTGSVAVRSVEGALRAQVSGSGDLEVDGLLTAVDVHASSTGDIEVEGIDAEAVEAHATGSGDIVLKGRATGLTASVESTGDIDADALEVQWATVRGSGTGDLRVHAADRVDGQLSSTGDLRVAGGAEVTVTTTGTGDVDIR